MADVGTNHKAKVFISYSRDDIDFADRRVEPFGFDTLTYRHSMRGRRLEGTAEEHEMRLGVAVGSSVVAQVSFADLQAVLG